MLTQVSAMQRKVITQRYLFKKLNLLTTACFEIAEPKVVLLNKTQVRDITVPDNAEKGQVHKAIKRMVFSYMKMMNFFSF